MDKNLKLGKPADLSPIISHFCVPNYHLFSDIISNSFLALVYEMTNDSLFDSLCWELWKTLNVSLWKSSDQKYT